MRLVMVFAIAVFCLVACKSEDKNKSNTTTSSSDTNNPQVSEQDVKTPIVDQSMLFSDNSDYQAQTSDVTMTTQDNPSNPTTNPNSGKNANLIPPKPTAEEIRLANIAKQAIMQYGNALQTGKTHQQAYEEFQQYIKQQNVTPEEAEQLNDMMEIMGGYMGAEAGWKNRSDNNVEQSGKAESPEMNNHPTTTGTNATPVNATESDVNPYSLQQMQSQSTSSNSNSIQEKSEAAQVKNPSSKNEAFDFNDLPVPVSVGGKAANLQPLITTPSPATEMQTPTQQPQQPQTQQTQTPQQMGTESRLQTLINQYDTSKQPKEKGTNQSGNAANKGE